MKTSNKLLISLFAVLFLAMIGSSMILKAEFDKINQHDAYYGYTSEPIEPFTTIVLDGNYPGLVQVEPGDAFYLKSIKNSGATLQWTVQHDTLHITFQHPDRGDQHQPEYSFFNRRPGYYITAPALWAIHSKGITCKLNRVEAERLELNLQGNQRGVQLMQCRVGELTASVAQGGMVVFSSDNRISQARLSVHDSSSLTVENHAIDSLQLEVAPEAHANLPGTLISQMMQSVY
uniref:Uncharacterized protein n=1 Tax=Roseihalotalea indica TaxID=2867963 RepID=A0AA49GKN1_9BACT|nr:hypothetical protein K4G66_27070 [Tunicatimonas sp. TK19036]